ncbi:MULTISPECIES: hypothetical protein [Actinomycetaceae]|uniref:Uncharacterized protein n=1 Tax=Trueperella abortisuis TaxID=445930 RepID=A0ABT9PJD9_9ACTO|nr:MULTISPECIES: hypothetical protein [Actinomycetaceae]MCI7305530.1 hypothetical protein [Trueperella sp.]MCI7456936.1 hypothetical protein [Actinomyces urogenitalis]MDP9832840.1 hypothetical protein [Trueperella abortisuis]
MISHSAVEVDDAMADPGRFASELAFLLDRAHLATMTAIGAITVEEADRIHLELVNEYQPVYTLSSIPTLT